MDRTPMSQISGIAQYRTEEPSFERVPAALLIHHAVRTIGGLSPYTSTPPGKGPTEKGKSCQPIKEMISTHKPREWLSDDH